MAQGRMLKKEISDSKKLGLLHSDRPRVLYFMMLPHLDMKGRLKAEPQIIKGQITTMLHYSVGSIQNALKELHRVGLITLYQAKDDQCLEYTRFSDFQTINPDREAESKIPAPTPEDSGELRRTPLKDKLNISKVKVNESKYSDSFEEFWKLFKGRWNPDKDDYRKGSKPEAFKSWKKLMEADQQNATKGAPFSGDKYTPDCYRWLREKRWEK